MKKESIIVLIVLQLILLSCKKEEKKFEKKTVKQYPKNGIMFNMVFPDTVYLNKVYDGIVNYESLLDTITTSFDEKKKKRYVLFYLTIVDKPYKDYKQLKKDAKIFGADNNREIPIYDIKFTKPGIYYIDGIINDYVVLDINRKDVDGHELVREIENEQRLVHKVVVVDKL